MLEIKAVELAEKSNELLKEINKGHSCLIKNKDNPIAEIIPIKKSKKGWLRNFKKIKLNNNISVQKFIEEERNIR